MFGELGPFALVLTCPLALIASTIALYFRCQGRDRPDEHGGPVGHLASSRKSIFLALVIIVLMAAIANLGVFLPVIIPATTKSSLGPIGFALLLPFTLLSDKNLVGTDREDPKTIWGVLSVGLVLLTRKLDYTMIEDRERWIELVQLDLMLNSELLRRTRVVSERIFGRIDGLAARKGALQGYVDSVEKMIIKADNPRGSSEAVARARRSAERSFKQMRRRAYRWGYYADHIWAVGGDPPGGSGVEEHGQRSVQTPR